MVARRVGTMVEQMADKKVDKLVALMVDHLDPCLVDSKVVSLAGLKADKTVDSWVGMKVC